MKEIEEAVRVEYGIIPEGAQGVEETAAKDKKKEKEDQYGYHPTSSYYEKENESVY